jgi:hypothetical protein
MPGNQFSSFLYATTQIVKVSVSFTVTLCYAVIRSRIMRWAEHVAHMGDRRGSYGGLVGRPEGKRLLGRPGGRGEDNIKMDL